MPPVSVPGPATALLDAPAPPQVEPDGPQPPRTRPKWLVPVVVAVIAVVLGVVTARWVLAEDDATSPQQVDDAIGEALSSTTIPAPIGPAIYNTALPSLAFIQTGEPGEEEASIGSGVIINTAGNIMTSNHVIDGAAQIRVTFADGTEATARVVQADPAVDIAVLEADRLPEVVVPAVLGGDLRVGDPIFAIGNPLGLGGSFSAGVVSGLERTLPLPDGQDLEQLIQFDAAVNPGSSGGPLLDRNAQVVGIVTAIANPTGEDFFSGIGFAVPIATAGGAAGGPEQ